MYQQTLVNYYGCDSVVTLNLTINPLPTIFAGNDFDVCEGQSVVLSALGGSNYTWNNGVLNGISFVPTVTNSYIVEGEGANGCVNTDTVLISVYPYPQLSIAQLSSVLCENESADFVAQLTDVSTSYSIQWLYNGNPIGTNSASLQINSVGDGDQVTAELANLLGCSATVMSNQLILQVNEVDTTYIAYSICDGESISVEGIILSTAGEHVVTTQSYLGCDSVIVVDLTLIPSYFAEDNVYICEGDSYIFGGQTLSVSGLYQEVFSNQYGCDSIISLQLYVTPAMTNQTVEICNGDTYVLGSQLITNPGQYVELFVNQHGCDSLVTLEVTLLPVYNQTMTVMICEGESFQLGTQSLTQPGFYSELFSSSTGCDSLVNVNLGVRLSDYILVFDTICSGSSYDFNGQLISTAGLHTQMYQNQYGCDSVRALELFVTPAPIGTIQYNLCAGQTLEFYGQTISQSGAYSTMLTTVKGCDSILVASVLYFSPTFVSASEIVCPGETYLFGNTLLVEPGTYVHTFSSVFGCDSTVTLTFGFEPSPPVIWIGAMLWVTTGEQFVWFQDGESLEGEVFQGYTPLVDGVYTVQVTTENGCVHNINTPVTAHLQHNADINLKIFPTVTNDLVWVESDMPITLNVYNVLGELIEHTVLRNGTISFGGQPSGMYFIHALDGDKRMVFKILKE